jgi:DNA-binding NtrC family response regulator
VRELRNVLEQAAVLASGSTIEEHDLRLDDAARTAPAAPLRQDLASLPFSEAKRHTVERFEREFLLGALRAHDGNISRAAESIGMVRQSLQQKIRELGLRDEEWSDGADAPDTKE